MSVVIITKYVGPTNARGSRVKAVTGDNNPATGRPDSITISWDCALNSSDNHKAAAKALAERLKWEGEWHSGETDTGCVFIRLGASSTFKVEG